MDNDLEIVQTAFYYYFWLVIYLFFYFHSNFMKKSKYNVFSDERCAIIYKAISLFWELALLQNCIAFSKESPEICNGLINHKNMSILFQGQTLIQFEYMTDICWQYITSTYGLITIMKKKNYLKIAI